MGEEASDNISLDSAASSTASDVLIRSTSLHMSSSQRKVGSRLTAGGISPLHQGSLYSGVASVELGQVASGNAIVCQGSNGRRVGEAPALVLPDFVFKKRDPTRIPPALPANKYPAVTLALMDDTISGPTVQTTDSAAQKVLVTKHFQDPAEEKNVMRKPLEGSIQKSKDVQISHFTTGQKENLLAALNKRAQSGPVTKHVPIQLLHDIAGKSQKTEMNRETSDIQATSIAAATAAAIAATAPVLKVQSNLEAQVNSVSQLLNKLQEADKQLQILTEQHSKIQSQPAERLYQGRVSELERQLSLLTEQRLQHLEKLQQQQLEMQSQFMTSAIKASASHREATAPVCSHLPATLLPQSTAPPKIEKASAPAVSEGKSDAGKSPLETPAPRRFAPVPISMDVQEPSKSSLGKENVEELGPSTSGKVPFLQEILRRDNAPVSRTTYKTHSPLNLTASESQPFRDSYLQNKHACATQTSSTAVQKANDVLQDLGALKQEMQSMMKDARQWKAQDVDLQPMERPAFSTSLSKSPIIWRKAINPPKSMCEDAECILREVQNKRKVLEDNLEAVARANDWTRRYTLISTLATDSDVTEKIRLQKLVDSVITEITAEVQDEMAKEDSKKKKADESCKESAVRKNTGSAKDIKDRYRDIKAPSSSVMKSTKPTSGGPAKPQCKKSGEKLAGLSGKVLSMKDGSSKGPQKVDVSSVMDEEMLNRVYGTPVYQGHRSTMKKGPYLRFGSPPAKPKPQRPKVLETVRGVKLKSAKIQTASPDMERVIVKSRSPEYSLRKSYEPQYAFVPSGEMQASDTTMQGHLIEMAIPLGRPRFGRAAPLPSAVILAHPQPVVNISIPPKPVAEAVKPNIAVVKIKSEKKDPPQLSVQVLPCVDIDSITSDSPGTSHRTPSPDLPPRTPSPVKTDIQLPENVETEEEILALPGSSVQEADVTPDDQVEDVPEPLLELDGFGDTNPPQYGGIPFPPPAPALQTDADVLDGITLRRETMVNRLAGRLEQEIFDRVVSEMQSKRQDIIPHVTPSSSDSSESVSSAIDAPGVPVESGLLRQYVEEFMAEKVAMILAERKTQRSPPPEQTVVQPVEITPVPTPQCTPPSSPVPPPREMIVRTPELSPQASLDERQQEPGKIVNLTPVVTPTITPVASPIRANTPISHISEDHEEPASVKSPCPNAWSNTELPLDEENPHSLKEAVLYKDAVVMTVAEEEEPKSLISVTSPETQKPIVPSPIREVTPPHSSSSSSTSTEQSSTITESDTPDKPLSEGEVLYSDGQIIVPRDLAAGGLVFPNLMESFSSTLKDANDMEFDPPSEGQIMDRGAHHDPVRLLLAKLNQDSLAPQEVFYHPESSGDENSMGEISEGQRPRLTPAAEQILVGHSAFIDPGGTTGQTAGHLRRHPSTHGPQMNIPGESQRDADNISSGPMSLGDLESQLLPAYYPHAEDLHQIPAAARNTSQGPGEPQREHQPVPTRLIQVGVKSSDDPQQGIREDSERTVVEPSVYLNNSGESFESPKKMSVTLPSMIEDDEDVKTTFLESDSSGADTF